MITRAELQGVQQSDQSVMQTVFIIVPMIRGLQIDQCME
jgi:hypothetical protein